MKKICLLFSIILCCLSGFAQTLQSAVTVVSGGDAILTVSGESASGYISNIIYKSQTVSPATANVLISTPEYGGPPYPIAPTKFKITVTGYFNNLTTPITAKVIFRTLIWNQNGNANVEVDQTVTLTVTPPAGPVTIYNQPQSGVFYKNNCGAGFASDPYTYTVPAGRYSGSSQVEANNKAQAEINANGQNTANANLTCKQVYYNTEVSGSFTRNTCGSNTSTEPVSYTVPANQFKGFSQADADAKANSELNIKGQANANNIGVCTPIRYIYGPDSMYMLADNYFSVINTSPGDSFKWIFPASRFTIRGGINNDRLDFTVKRGGGTNDYTFPLQVEVTKANGQVITLTKDVTILYCLNCPL